MLLEAFGISSLVWKSSFLIVFNFVQVRWHCTDLMAVAPLCLLLDFFYCPFIPLVILTLLCYNPC